MNEGVRFWNLFNIMIEVFNKHTRSPDYVIGFNFFDKRITVESVARKGLNDTIIYDFNIESITDYKTDKFKCVISKDIHLDNWLLRYGHLELNTICNEMEKVIISFL